MSSEANSVGESIPLPSGQVHGRVAPPGSKSETNRWINLAILARQSLRLRGALRSEDIELFLTAAQSLGLTVGEDGGDLVLAPRGGEDRGLFEPIEAAASARGVGRSGSLLRQWRHDDPLSRRHHRGPAGDLADRRRPSPPRSARSDR